MRNGVTGPRPRIVPLVTAALGIAVGWAGPLDHAEAASSRSTCRPHWVGSWITSPSDGLGAALANQTLRMIVAPHLGGRRLRLHFSNRFGATPVTLDRVEVGLRGTGAALVDRSSRAVRFAHRRAVTIPPGQEVVSDPVRLHFQPFQDLAVSVYVAGTIPSSTEHFNTRQTSYLTPSGTGDHAGDQDAAAFTKMTGGVFSVGWYFLDGVDVRAPGKVGAVTAFGDSLTDGFQGNGTPLLENHEGLDADGRYPDDLARRPPAARCRC